MKREAIEKLLKDNGIAEDKIKAAVDMVMTENGKDIEAEKVKIAAKEAEITAANQTITGLKDAVKKYDGVDVDGLKAKAADLETKYNTDIEAEKKKAGDIVKEYALKDALRTAGAVDPDYLIFKHGGIDKFAFSDDNKPVGVEDTIKADRESMPHVFCAANDTDGKSKVIVNSGGEHKPGSIDTVPETLRGALEDAYKK